MAVLESKHFDHASFRHFNTELIYWKKCGLRRRADDGREGFLVSGQMDAREREMGRERETMRISESIMRDRHRKDKTQ